MNWIYNDGIYYDQYGFDEKGLNKDGYDIYGFDEKGLNKDGLNNYGYKQSSGRGLVLCLSFCLKYILIIVREN